MCGRFNILTDVDALLTTFNILESDSTLASFKPRYNVSPTSRSTAVNSADETLLTKIPIVRLEDDKRLVLRSAIWPLIPAWSKGEVPKKYSMANARSENMRELVSYRNAWRYGRRCLIPATGFYEWQIVSQQRTKQPWHIQHKEQEIMSFAGLWERGKTEDGTEYESCTIVTAEANALMATIHNSNRRMPVIIDPELRDQWLCSDLESAYQMTKSYEDDRLKAYPISTRINNPNYTQRDCIDPIELDQ